MNEEITGGTIQRYRSSLSESECYKLKLYAAYFAACEPALEIGSYTGASTICIGLEYKKHNNIVYSIDHHRGSPEQQVGKECFEESFHDKSSNKIDTFKTFRENIEKFDLEKTIIPIVCDSDTVARNWNIPLSFLFIDGDHSIEQSLKDLKNFAPHIVEGGILSLHDVDLEKKNENSYEGPRAAFFEAIRMGFTPIDFKYALAFLRKGKPELYNISEKEIKEITGYEN